MSVAIDVTREIGVVLSRSTVDNPWIDHLWSPHAALFPAPATAAGAVLSDDGRVRLVYAGPAVIELFAPETGNYRDNLADGAPRLWIAARRNEAGTPETVRVTADPTEGEAWFEAGVDLVATVAMPQDVAAWIAAFVDAFHVERAFQKRQRDRSERGRQGYGRPPEGGG